MKFSFAHVVSIISGGLATLAALNPVIVATVVPAPFVPYAVAAIAGAGVLINIIHGVTPAASTAAKLLPLAFVAVLVGSSLTGCASVESFLNSPTGSAVVAASVDVAVATAEQKGVTAAQINKVAKAALVADTGVSGTLAAVSALVDQAIASANLPAADLAAAKILEVAIGAAIQANVGNNASLAQAQAAVADVLKEVIAATGG